MWRHKPSKMIIPLQINQNSSSTGQHINNIFWIVRRAGGGGGVYEGIKGKCFDSLAIGRVSYLHSQVSHTRSGSSCPWLSAYYSCLLKSCVNFALLFFVDTVFDLIPLACYRYGQQQPKLRVEFMDWLHMRRKPFECNPSSIYCYW